MSELLLYWNDNLSRCHDYNDYHHVTSSPCRPDIEYSECQQRAYDRWFQWSVDFFMFELFCL